MARNKKGKAFRGTRSKSNTEKRQQQEIDKLKQDASNEQREKELAKQPHSFVIHRGKVGKYVKALEQDLRHMMEPNTAKNLKTLKRNNIKDYVVTGAVLGVTNMMVLTVGDTSVQLRMMRFSQGPTITFKVNEYSISRHILSSQRRPLIHDKLFAVAPLVIMSGFEGAAKHQTLVQTFIQNMFPTINIDSLNLKTVKRCLLVHYNKDEDTFEMRQYSMRVVASGLSKSTKKLVQADNSHTKAIPDLSKYKDISEFMLNPGQLSDSEFEGEQEEVELAQDLGIGCSKGDKSNIRLYEIGPRLKMELLKIEEGLDEGEVLYHRYVQKTPQEVADQRKKLPILKREKKRRQYETEQRVIRRLEHAAQRQKEDEDEEKQMREKLARRQAAATGQTEDIENQKMKDREIAMNRERETGEEQNEGGSFGGRRGRGRGRGGAGRSRGGGGEGQNRSFDYGRKRSGGPTGGNAYKKHRN